MQAFIIGADFISNDIVVMVLGDDIFARHGLKKRLVKAVENEENGDGATVFGYYVDDPEIGIVGPDVVGEYKGTASAEGYCLADGTMLKLSEKDQLWLRSDRMFLCC